MCQNFNVPTKGIFVDFFVLNTPTSCSDGRNWSTETKPVANVNISCYIQCVKTVPVCIVFTKQTIKMVHPSNHI